jgi:hypothetical protein
VITAGVAIAHMITTAVISALAIAARSRARINKTPALRIDRHRLYQTGATILFGTDTFLSGYARYVHGTPLDAGIVFT